MGLPVPWYAVYGNHDTLLLGTFDLSSQLHTLAVGGQEVVHPRRDGDDRADRLRGNRQRAAAGLDALGRSTADARDSRRASDAGRFLFDQREFMAEHFPTAGTPGPIGHGFTQHNLDSGETWWQTELTPQVRAFGLDTCNQVAGPDGAVPDDQFRWLTTELAAGPGRAAARPDLQPPQQPHAGEPAPPGPASTSRCTAPRSSSTMLLRYPVVVGWLNGHTHLNQILAHRGPRGVLGDHDGVVHRLPAATTGGRARGQPRRNPVDLHDGARPRVARHARQQRQATSTWHREP